jgi:hypothetical protein
MLWASGGHAIEKRREIETGKGLSARQAARQIYQNNSGNQAPIPAVSGL